MKKIAFPYGKGTVEYDFENENLAAVLTSGIHDYRCDKDGATLVREAMASPIGSPRLCELAKGKKIGVSEACTYLSEVGLCARDYVNREINSSLSGGELKRIEIATLLARSTKLSVFDEPEAGIDLWSFQNLIRIFENMRIDIKDSSIVIISHQERILRIADQIVLLTNGEIKKTGTADDVLPELIGTTAAVNACEKLK